ncbi:hypothetical protein PAHAL_1G102100 [Panicum hallii]|uniref:Peroxidase n=1 Tax=Panicum hallii TaxID=206008 RepID=A0A2S3GN98_9POAL|nr:cationic peroxidase 1-like [Panicum hallii]PAN04925.1 hypothetical protein PAHAL_1G102100 [Panicum hallii]
MASSTTAAGRHFCFLLALLLLSATAHGQLSKTFYAASCPPLDQIVRDEVSRALFRDPPPLGGRRMGASLLRLFFHDCFVQGCDASVLLDVDVTKGILLSEKDAGPNANSLRGFEVVDAIKSQVEAACPGVVSCADILALATREAVVALNGTTWPLLLGRRDSRTANQSQANSDLPSPGSNLDTLIAAFARKGFTATELVALSGAHTVGLAHCVNVDQSQMQRCRVPTADGLMAALDDQTPERFDSAYYDKLGKRGLLRSDRVLTSRPDLDAQVRSYSASEAAFFADFASAMKKMSEVGVLTGANGEVRAYCRRIN